MIFSDVLSVDTGVGGCGWTISARSVHMDVFVWKFSNDPSNSASVSGVMMLLMMLYSKCTGPFSRGVAVIGVFLIYFLPIKIYSPDLLRAHGSDM